MEGFTLWDKWIGVGWGVVKGVGGGMGEEVWLECKIKFFEKLNNKKKKVLFGKIFQKPHISDQCSMLY